MEFIIDIVRLATLALRAHTASRTDCIRLGTALANTLGELARTAASRQLNNAGKNHIPTEFFPDR